MEGKPVGLGLWKEAQAELLDAEYRLKATSLDDKIVVQSPEMTVNDHLIRALGSVFHILEAMIVEMIKKGAMDSVRGDVADTMMQVRKLLKQLNFEPIKHRRHEPITFNTKQPPKKP